MVTKLEKCLTHFLRHIVFALLQRLHVGRRATRGGIWGKALHSNFDICRNFQRIKMKFYIVIIFKKPYWNFSLFCWLIISLQDLP